MLDYNQTYKHVEITEDDSNGQIKLSIVTRHGENRKTKLKNNFVGLLDNADSRLLLELCHLLNKKLPNNINDELVVGMYKSGIIMAGYLALERRSSFTWSTPDKLGDYEDAIYYNENHRNTEAHYFYGLKSGDRVILVEDEITSGKGMVGLTKVLREQGIEVRAICSILETVNFGGRDLIETETGLSLISLARVELS